MTTQRLIAHVDMDAFYASVMIRDRPDLQQVPVVVGGGHRGVVLSANYLARESGVRSAMPMTRIKRMCPEAVIIAPDYDDDALRDETDDEELDVHHTPIQLANQADLTSANVGDTIPYTIVVQHAPASDGSNIYNVTVSDVFGITPIYVGGDDGDGRATEAGPLGSRRALADQHALHLLIGCRTVRARQG